MPRYYFEAKTQNGIRTKDEIDAPSEIAAKSILRDQGLFVLSISLDAFKESELPWYRKDFIVFGSSKAVQAEVLEALSMLAELLHSGFSESESLQIVQSSLENDRVKRDIGKTISALSEGHLFNKSLTDNISGLPISIRTVLGFELPKSSIAQLLQQVTVSEKKRNMRRQKINSALLYPMIILAAAFCLILVIVFFLMPNLVPLFESMGSDVPPTLRFFETVRVFLETNISVLVFGAGLFGVCSFLFWRNLKAVFSRLLLRLPLLSSFKQNQRAGEFALLLSSLTRSGLPLQDATYVLAKELERDGRGSVTQLSRDLEAGLDIGASFKKLSGYPNAFVSLLVMAANTKSFANILGAQADHYFEKSERASEKLVALITPALLIVVGGIVASVIFTISTAILDINDAAFLQN